MTTLNFNMEAFITAYEHIKGKEGDLAKYIAINHPQILIAFDKKNVIEPKKTTGFNLSMNKPYLVSENSFAIKMIKVIRSLAGSGLVETKHFIERGMNCKDNLYPKVLYTNRTETEIYKAFSDHDFPSDIVNEYINIEPA